MKLDPQLLEFAKSMRHSATDVEHLMWVLYAKHFTDHLFLFKYKSVWIKL